MFEISQIVAADLTRMVRWAAHHSGRSQQRDLGPSEIGHPCDRKMAYKMGGARRRTYSEPLPAFLGTGGHAALEDAATRWEGQDPDAIEKAEQNPDDVDAKRRAALAPYRTNPRYITETKVTVPGLADGGTLDLFDTWLKTVIDHKWVGGWSLDRARRHGPPDTYRYQAHTYGLGWHFTHGTPPEHVAIAFWPRENSNTYGTKAALDYLYVWSEPYRPELAARALARVKDMRRRTEGMDLADHPELAGAFDTVPGDCRFCDWYVPGSDDLRKGCPGK